jgi:hypothetical protein
MTRLWRQGRIRLQEFFRNYIACGFEAHHTLTILVTNSNSKTQHVYSSHRGNKEIHPKFGYMIAMKGKLEIRKR